MNKLIVPLALLLIAVTLQLSYAEAEIPDQKLMPIGIELNSAHKKLQKTIEHLNEMNLPSFNENCFSQLALLNIEKISALCSYGSSFILVGNCIKDECMANYYTRALGIMKFVEDQTTLCQERTDVCREQIKDEATLQLVDKAREVIRSSMQSIEKGIEILETVKGISKET